MKPDVDMPEFDRGTPPPPGGALRVYGDAMDDFPVLKAFQQYIDAEQAKARKRILYLGIFFGILTGAIIAVFVALLMNMTMRNQQLNDRLVEYAMKDRERPPVVVQSAPQSDNSAFMASLVAKLESMQSKIAEVQAKATEASVQKPAPADAPAAAQDKAAPSAEAVEIEKLRALLAAEREKAAVEKERRRQEELEEYRRKHYPELYGAPRQQPATATPRTGRRAPRTEFTENEIDEILKEIDEKPISYFDDDDDDENAAPAKAPAKKKRPAQKKAAAPETGPAPEPAPQAQEPAYSIPVDVKKSKRSWRIPPE